MNISVLESEAEVEVWYRFDDYWTAPPFDADGDPCGKSTPHVRLVKLYVVKHTPKGVWLSLYPFGLRDRFVLKDARKRWACPTIEEAKKSFLARKKRQLGIYRARAKSVERMLEIFYHKFGDLPDTGDIL